MPTIKAVPFTSGSAFFLPDLAPIPYLCLFPDLFEKPIVNYLLVENLTKSFGEKLLFEDITFGLEAGQKVALIAKNGAGKTTLLNIIMGTDSPDSGSVTFRNDLKISYLSQNPFLDESHSILEVLFTSDNDYIKALREYELCLSRLNTADTPANHTAFEQAMATMDRLHAWDIEARAKEILGKFEIHRLDQAVRELSGGQKKKLALAKVLIEEVDLLILDEPTNHLDIAMIEWLEEYLTRGNLCLLLVTHDRYFLDNVCDSILELENGRIYRYWGDYSYYLIKKAEREQNESAELEKVKGIYLHELDWMRRGPKARTTKSKARIDAFFDLEEKASKRLGRKPPDLSVKTQRMGGKILEINNICKAYGDLVLIDDFSHTFKRGEKIGIVGRNGCGKTTFIDILMGKTPADKGRFVKGQTVEFGYFSQDGIEPPGDQRIIDIVKDIAEVIPLGDGHEMAASQFLNHFGFNYQTQYNYYHNLSGGERRKLSLLMTLMRNPNFLLLDEPTNDLDIFTLTLLEDFLNNFNGCVMFVSHDRYFIDKMADHIFVFEEKGKIKDYYGSYTNYHLEKQKREAAIRRKQIAEKPKKELLKGSDEPLKLTYKQKIEFETLEKEIEILEDEKSQILAAMSNPDTDGKTLQEKSIRYSELEHIIDEKTTRWLELAEISG